MVGCHYGDRWRLAASAGRFERKPSILAAVDLPSLFRSALARLAEITPQPRSSTRLVRSQARRIPTELIPMSTIRIDNQVVPESVSPIEMATGTVPNGTKIGLRYLLIDASLAC